ncbi:MAG: hypothetical protein R3219_00635 [Hydrogenovibrio sp.]|nr:hypothetical protein [Hydrogenovibrio sp.]
MLRFELAVESGSFFETYDNLTKETELKFTGPIVTPVDRFMELQRFDLSIQVKNNNRDSLGEGELLIHQNQLNALICLTRDDIQHLIDLLPSLASGALSLTFFVLIDNDHEIFDERKTIKDDYRFEVRDFVKHIGYDLSQRS